MRKLFSTLFLGAAMFGAGMGVSQAQVETPALEVKETFANSQEKVFAGGTKVRKKGLKGLNAKLKRKGMRRMQRKSRQINRI